MKRYFFYLIVINMLVNVIAFVPKILIEYRYRGAVSAIPLAVAAGGLFMLVFISLIRRFPKKSLPEIFYSCYPSWVYRPVICLLTLVWVSAGTLQLLVYSEYTIRFINPDLQENLVYSLMGITVLLAARNGSRSILYLLEIVLMISIPMIVFIFLKAMLNHSLRWDSIYAVLQYYRTVPHFSSFAAASYLFSGYANLVILNRVFPSLPSIKWLWMAIPVGFMTILTSFMIPIGYLGADGAGNYVFPWMMTSDSMRMEMGFVERVMYVFYTLYGFITFGSMILHWHVALEMVKATVYPRFQSGVMGKWLTAATFAAILILVNGLGSYLTDPMTFLLGEVWLDVRVVLELVMVLLLWIAARRLKEA